MQTFKHEYKRKTHLNKWKRAGICFIHNRNRVLEITSLFRIHLIFGGFLVDFCFQFIFIVATKKEPKHCASVYCSLVSRRRRTADRTEAAAVVEYTQAPPATVRLHRLHDQIPTTARFMESWNVCFWKKKKKKRIRITFGSKLIVLWLDVRHQ